MYSKLLLSTLCALGTVLVQRIQRPCLKKLNDNTKCEVL